MSEPLTPTELRANLFRILDEVLTTGRPCEVIKGGRRLAIVSLQSRPLQRPDLPRREAITCSPEELEAIHWDYVPDEEPLR